MADTFGLELTGDVRATLRLHEFPKFAHDHLLRALQKIEVRLKAAVLAGEPVQTGALKAMTGGRVYDHDNRIAAVVGVRARDANSARKAAALEYGSRGIPIAMHRHAISLAGLTARASRPLKPDWQRVPTIKERRFLRGPLNAIRSGAIAEMKAAIEAAIADSDT